MSMKEWIPEDEKDLKGNQLNKQATSKLIADQNR